MLGGLRPRALQDEPPLHSRCLKLQGICKAHTKFCWWELSKEEANTQRDYLPNVICGTSLQGRSRNSNQHQETILSIEISVYLSSIDVHHSWIASVKKTDKQAIILKHGNGSLRITFGEQFFDRSVSSRLELSFYFCCKFLYWESQVVSSSAKQNHKKILKVKL